MSNGKAATALSAVAGVGAGAFFATPAVAQDVIPTAYGANGEVNPLIWTLEGGAIFSRHTSNSIGTDDKLSFDRDVGGYGAISVRRFIEPDLDWRLTGRYGAFVDNNGSDSFNEFPISASLFGETSKEFASVDFDIGHHFQHPGVQGRIFAGVRGLYSREAGAKGVSFSDAIDKTSFDGASSGSSTFFGAGPRAGLEMLFKDEGDKFGIEVAGSAAVLLGNERRKQSFSGEFCNPFPGNCNGGSISQTRNRFHVLTNLAASLGVQMMVNDNSSVTIGYQGEMWTQRFFDDTSLIHGPFIRAEIAY